MSVFVRPFKKEDLDAFVPIESLGADEQFSDEFAQAVEDSGLSITGIRDGKIVGCGGTHPMDDFHGEMWLRLSKDCQVHSLSTLRWIKEGMAIIEETYPFQQLNAVVKCGFKKSIKLIEHLGFTRTEEKTHKGQKWAIYSKRVQDVC